MTDSFRLSPQQGFLLANARGAVSQCALLVPDGLDEDGLRARLHALCARHETLRTTFPVPAGARSAVAQAVHQDLAPGFVARNGTAGDPSELLEREAAEVDSERGPALRVLLAGRVLILTAPAACADPASLVILGRELIGGSPPEVEPIQHADYAEWRHELRGGDDPDAAAARAFWAQATEPADATRVLFGRGATSRGHARLTVELSADELQALAARAQAVRAPLERLIEAAWLAVLARLSNSAQLLTVSLSDGRSQPDLADAVGPYAQPLPLRVRLEPETSFLELLDRLQRARTEAERLQDYASEAELSALAERAIGGFGAMEVPSGLAFLSTPATGCALELAWLGAGRLALHYDTAAYDGRDASDVLAAFGTILSAVAADASRPVQILPLLDGEGRARALALASGPEPQPSLPAVHRQFEAIARRRPELPAVVAAGQSLTYGELEARAAQLAAELVARGAGAGQPVGLCLSRTPNLLVGLLGILKAGSAYLPLNAAHPAGRLAHQLAESGARLLLSESGLAAGLAGLAVEMVLIDELSLAGAGAPAPGGAGELAYVMYTSGSTGMPKGVAVTHENLANYTSALIDRLGAEEGLHFAAVSDISTDLGNTAIFPALASGGCVHLIEPQTAMDGQAFAAYAAEHPLDVIKITPTHLRALLAAGEGFLPRRWLVVGGEALPWELAERVAGAGGGCRILNHYGPTEATVGCCTFEFVSGADRPPAGTVPIGRAIAGARAYVLDARLEPLPVGVAGELCIGGAGVARGYLGRPEETAERFVADPQGGRMYRTGDRARVHRDGAIEFLGRLDHQLKIRGYRVEPGEIEAVLLRHPDIREAAVVGRAEASGESRLVAYFVAARELPVDELERFAGEHVPEYMVPSRWVPIAALPLTPSGKVDRLALPDPETAAAERRGRFVAPRDDLEREIAAIWAQLLGVEEVGVEDDFFALGGHSLLATQAIMRIRRAYGNLPLGAMFNSPTVAALAEVIRARATTG